MAKGSCTQDGCTSGRYVGGLCCRHHRQRVLAELTPADYAAVAPQFWDRVDRSGDCWTWTAGRNKAGYGQFYIQSVGIRAHRLSYQLTVGPIPDGRELDHLCRNRACVNPAHLEAVEKRVNILRGTCPAAVNARKDRCSRGHDFDHVTPDGRRDCNRCARIRKST